MYKHTNIVLNRVRNCLNMWVIPQNMSCFTVVMLYHIGEKCMRAEVGISNNNIKFYSMNYRLEKKAINIIRPSMFLF